MLKIPYVRNIHIKIEGKRKKFPWGKEENTFLVNNISRNDEEQEHIIWVNIKAPFKVSSLT